MWEAALNLIQLLVALGNEKTSLKWSFGVPLATLGESVSNDYPPSSGDLCAPPPDKLLIHRIRAVIILQPITHYYDF